MTTTQQMILDAILARAKRPLTIDFDFANTGYIRSIDETTLRALHSLRFEFQKERCSFEIPGYHPQPYDKFVATHYYGQERTERQIKAVKSTPMEVVDAVVAYLDHGTREEQRC
jgi:hypothetical protein